MKSMPKKPPSFFKIMFSNSPEKSMRFPSAFMKNFRESGIPNTFELKCDGKSWRVTTKMKKDGGLIVGGWPNFFKERNLEFGDFLVFKLVENSVFEIDVYARSGIEKAPTFVNLEDHGVQFTAEKEKEEIPIKENTAKRRKSEGFAGENTAKRSKIDFAGTNAKRGRKSKMEVDSESEFSSGEILLNNGNSKYQIPIPTKFARETGLESRKNISITDPEERKWTVSITAPVPGKPYLSTGWKNLYTANGLNLSSTILLKSSNGKSNQIELLIPNKSADVSVSLKKGRKFSEKTGKGSASTKLVVKHYSKYKIVVPKKFAGESGLRWKRETVVKDPEGREWPIGIFVSGTWRQIYLGKGWNDLRIGNGLGIGDAVLLRFNGAGNGIDLQILSRGSWKMEVRIKEKKSRREGKKSE